MYDCIVSITITIYQQGHSQNPPHRDLTSPSTLLPSYSLSFPNTHLKPSPTQWQRKKQVSIPSLLSLNGSVTITRVDPRPRPEPVGGVVSSRKVDSDRRSPRSRATTPFRLIGLLTPTLFLSFSIF